MKLVFTILASVSAIALGFGDTPANAGVLCEGNDAEDFCDCSGDCVEAPYLCACADAIACCGGRIDDTPGPTAYPTAYPHVIERPECADATNLRDVESPYDGLFYGYVGSGNTAENAIDCLDLSCHGVGGGDGGNEQGFEIELFPGETLVIGQTFNDYDSRHELRFGGVYPGDDSISCVDDPDYSTETFTNTEEAPVMVYFLVDAYSRYEESGMFTLEWEVTSEPLPDYDCFECHGNYIADGGCDGFTVNVPDGCYECGPADCGNDTVLCEGNDVEDFCDCSGDCWDNFDYMISATSSQSSLCACADAIACCEDQLD